MPANIKIAGAVGALLSGALLAASPVAMQAAWADECSGIMCIFGSRPAAPAQSAPQAPPAAAPAAPTATADATDTAKDQPKAAHKARPKPIQVVTIAADKTDVARLQSLAAVVRNPRVKFVEAKDGQAADFSVTTSLADGQGVKQAKLFGEAMHVVAGAKVKSFADLRGKTVSFGADGSAGQAVARKAFEAAGIKVAETPLDIDNALDGLSTGDIDAVVVVAPQPDARLTKLTPSGLHLVAWPDGIALPDGAVAASIDGAAYPGLAKPGDKVATLGVDAVLVASPKGARQPAAKVFLGALAQHSADLSKRGFGLLKADLATRGGRRVANNEAR